MSYRFTEIKERESGYLVTDNTVRDGTSSNQYHLTDVNGSSSLKREDLRAAILDVVGATLNLEPVAYRYAKDNPTLRGLVQRALPCAHPFCRQWGEKVTLNGIGPQSEINCLSFPFANTLQRQFTNYATYHATVQYKRPEYVILPDEAIQAVELDYYPPGATVGSPLVRSLAAAQEWQRYTWPTMVPLSDTVSTEFGQMKFSAPGAAVDGSQFLGSPYQYMGNQAIEITWYEVPLRYMWPYLLAYNDVPATFTPYLTRFVNTVNQTQFLGYAPGQLLYLGATPTNYRQADPVVKAEVIDELFSQEIATWHNLVADFKLRFVATFRQGSNLPAAPADRNVIVGGHNLMPHFQSRKFHYVKTTDSKPLFDSAPHQLLFTDPCMVHPDGGPPL